MMSLLFLLHFFTLLLALRDRYQIALVCFGVALLLDIVWLHHHASDSLGILL